jgi:DNA-binding NtrC family response regulator
MKILILDDNKVQVGLMQLYLERAKHSTVTALTVDEAKDIILKSSDIDLALVDLSLPGEDGISFLDFLKEKNIKIPVIITTGVDHHILIDIAKKYQVQYLRKPFVSTEILKTIDILFKETGDGR